MPETYKAISVTRLNDRIRVGGIAPLVGYDLERHDNRHVAEDPDVRRVYAR